MTTCRMIFVILFSLAGLSVDAQRVSAAETLVGGATGEVSIELDKTTISANEPIRGHLLFKLEKVRDRFGKTYDAVSMNGPLVNIVVPDGMTTAMPKVTFISPLRSPIKVGHQYRLRFHVHMDESFRNLLRKPKLNYNFFKPGSFLLEATVLSPPNLSGSSASKSPFALLTQRFKSKSVRIRVQSGPPDTVTLDSKLIRHAIDQATGETKRNIIVYHVNRGDLSPDELLGFIEAASGSEKAALVEFYLSRNLPIEKLKDFAIAGQAVHFTGHDQPPVFLLMQPNQRVRITFKVDSVHRMKIGSLDKVITANSKIDFTAPRAAGLYEMYDNRHEKPWGWILVRGNTTTKASDKLRPENETLAAKVAEAIFRRDADTLSTLAVPDFRSDDLIRKMKFKLGDGDIRYFKSTGTKNSVKTRMQVNIASAGEDPVFARELILEFVRIGNELKLKQAAVVDAD